MHYLNPIMENNKLKLSVVHALASVLTGQALVELSGKLTSKFYKEAFERFSPKIDNEVVKSSRRDFKAGRAITDPNSLYLASESTIKNVMSYVCEEMKKRGFHVKDLRCPMEKAKLDLRSKEDALLSEVKPITQLDVKNIPFTQRQKAINLTLNLLVKTAIVQGFNLNEFKYCLGEKIEALLYSRQSGLFGEYIKPETGEFGRVLVDGMNYKIRRCVELDSCWFWEVTNLNTNSVVQLKDKYDLASLQLL